MTSSADPSAVPRLASCVFSSSPLDATRYLKRSANSSRGGESMRAGGARLRRLGPASGVLETSELLLMVDMEGWGSGVRRRSVAIPLIPGGEAPRERGRFRLMGASLSIASGEAGTSNDRSASGDRKWMPSGRTGEEGWR